MDQFIEVTFPSPVTVQTLSGTVEVTELKIFEIVDNRFQKKLHVKCNNHPTVILLWEGAAYDAKGEWTTADIVARVLEIYA